MIRANSAALRRAGAASAFLGGLALLAGCASFPPVKPLTAEQCSAIDWSGVGRDDGANGAPSTILARHLAACPGLPQEAWAQGRAQGLAAYCTAENGYRLGRAGREYHGVCPMESADLFLREYERGLAFRAPIAIYPSVGLGWGGGWGWGGPRWGLGMGWRSGWW